MACTFRCCSHLAPICVLLLRLLPPPIQFYVRKTEMLPLSAQHSGEQQHVDSAAHLQLTPQRACRRDGMFVFSLASSSSPILLFPVAATELGVDCAGLWLLLVKLKPSHVAVRLVCFLPSLHLVRACVCVRFPGDHLCLCCGADCQFAIAALSWNAAVVYGQ